MTTRARSTSGDAVRRDSTGRSPNASGPAGLGGPVIDGAARRGRGAVSNPHARFEPVARERFDDGWDLDEASAPLATDVTLERARTIITRNDSPDIGFDQSINPYRGCEHGCAYCFARPTHAYQGLSPGLDFETKLFAKLNAVELLEKELARPDYVVKSMALGTNTDPYQPIERRFRITRGILEVLHRTRHPVGIVTKSALVARDLDLLDPMAALNLAQAAVSITTLDPALARLMEPRAAAPAKRLETICRLAEAGVPTSVLVAPIIPGVNDHEIETVLAAAHEAGARGAGYVILRLPHELKGIMHAWLSENFPDKLKHVFSLVEDSFGGKLYDSAWGKRQTGVGPYAWMVGRRFETACGRLGFNATRSSLRTDLFTPPGGHPGQQLSLL